MENSEEDEAEKLGFKSRKEYAFYLKIKEILEGVEDEKAAEKHKTVYMSDMDEELYMDMTKNIVDTIEHNRLDGFASNIAKADQVEKAIQGALMTNKYYGFGYQKLKKLVSPLLELAKRHFA